MHSEQQGELKRTLGLALVMFYGLGTIVGAGIYVLVGEVAAVSGQLMPWAFLLAGIIAALTGLCYAELCARHPKAAGAVLYIDIAFANKAVSQFAGALLLLTGIVSAATISRGFVGYLQLYIDINEYLSIIFLCLILGTIAAIGIRESAGVVALITILEVIGLLMVIGLASSNPLVEPSEMPTLSAAPIILGAFLAFYAFIGFEDMVNLAEELKNPSTNMPRAIFMAISISTVLYIAIAVIAVRHTELDALAESSSPLAAMIGDTGLAVSILGLIGIVAITNGALTQIIMASRVLYGMAKRQILPGIFARVNIKTGTPIFSTVLITLVILAFALWLPLVVLAKITSAIMLVIFALVNISLIRIKKLTPYPGEGGFQLPLIVPVAALVVNLGLLFYQLIA